MLRARINRGGDLYLLRDNEWIVALCAKRVGYCSHKCPFFGEVVTYEGKNEKYDLLSLCDNNAVQADQIIDEREAANG